MNMGERLKELRVQKGATQEEVGKVLNVTKPTIMKYEKGLVENLKRTSIEKLAKYFDVTPSYLMCLEDSSNVNGNGKQVFPLLGIVKAGYNYLANENIIGWVNIDKKVSDPENYFALKVIGDSMQPILYEDDIVIVHKQSDIESGQIAIVLVDNEEATVKKLIKYDDRIELIAFNSYYPPRNLTKKDNFKIIGKVVEARISKIFE